MNWVIRQWDMFKLWKMWKFEKPFEFPHATNLSHFLDNLRKHKDRKIRRNLVAAIIKKSRLEYPYKVEDWSVAKKMWNGYFLIDGAIVSITDIITHMNAGKDIYVTKFRSEAPVKGDRRGSYFINSYGCGDHKQVLKCVEIKKHEEIDKFWYIRLESPNDKERYNVSLDEDSISCHRYSTQKEINDYKACRASILGLREEMEICRNKESDIREKINKLDLIYSKC